MAEIEAAASTVEFGDRAACCGNMSVHTLNGVTLSCLKRIFEQHAGKDHKWSLDQVRTFFQVVQDQGASQDVQHFLSKPELDFNDFLKYMTSSLVAATLPCNNQDLSWPLASYFISTSHNTYLSGNQLSSNSTTETYAKALTRGCRCVEIDVWDGEESVLKSEMVSSYDEDMSFKETASDGDKETWARKLAGMERTKLQAFEKTMPTSLSAKLDKMRLGQKGEGDDLQKHSTAATTVDEEEENGASKSRSYVVEPRVLHGHTLTSEIPFRQVCVTIRDNAFVTTDLPLIVSLEVHCNPQQQGVMVDIMKEVWGGFLVPELEHAPSELPSPRDLKGKILVKVKYVPPGSSLEGCASSDDEAVPPDARKRGKVCKTIQKLSRLGVYTRGVSFKAFTQPEATMATHVFSLSEKKFLSHHENFRTALLQHNKKYLMRAYPAGYRIRSSNLNPSLFWGSGTQMVALNWQQTDQGMMLNEGMFAGTGGYVLKPAGYRSDGKTTSLPNTSVTKDVDLEITMIAAQSIPLPPGEKTAKGFRPYIQVDLHVDGSPGQQLRKVQNEGHEKEGEYKARSRTHSGPDCDLQWQRIEFKTMPDLVDELTFVRFVVRDDEIGRDELAAWACVRLDRLAQGYRFVRLANAHGDPTEGVLLVKVCKRMSC